MGHGYMGSPFVFNRHWLVSMLQRIEQLYGKPWKQYLYESPHYSEFSLYGVFVDEYLKPPELILHAPYQKGIWMKDEFGNEDALAELVVHKIDEAINQGKLSIIVQSNLECDVEVYELAAATKLGLA
jgi:hypothetical protein